MRTVMFFLLWLATAGLLKAQRLVFDPHHLNTVNENGSIRFGAEATANSYLGIINSRLSDIKLNMGAVVLVQDMIRASLTQVNHALKGGLSLVQIGQLSTDILDDCSNLLTAARSEPYLLLFAEEVASQAKLRSLRLVTEVSDFVLKEGSNVLMDYQKRDDLLAKIILELRVIRTLCYSMGKSIYWAKVNGALKTANPYKNFINRDRAMAEQILHDFKSLNLN